MSPFHRVSSLFVIGLFAVGCSSGSDESGSVSGPDTSTSSDASDETSSTEDTATSTDSAGEDSTTVDSTSGDSTGGDSASADSASDTAPVDTCAATCTLGAKVCDGNQVRECVSVAGCPTLSAPLPCPSGTVCSGGACAVSCTDACTTIGATQCSGDNIQTCETKSSGCKDWSVPTACPSPKACRSNVCALTCTDACTLGAKRCGAGDTVETCETKATGCTDWSTAVACPSGQSCTGSGVCMACTTGTKRCNTAGNVETCNSGSWLETTACSFGCASGSCSSSVSCTAGAYRCNGNAVEICNSSGTAWLYNSSCLVSCASGLCTGACTPGAKRCNAGKSETCNSTGTAWDVTETCTTVCDPGTGKCALSALTIDPTTTSSFDGEIVVDGVVTVKAGSTLKSDTGNLTIRAKSIVVETGGSIVVAPTGDYAGGAGYNGYYQGYPLYCYYGGGGGTYASANATESYVGPGSRGGSPYGGSPVGGKGGGVLRLVADTISIAGTVTANGQNGTAAGTYGASGGGSGGGILVAANSLTVSGVISAVGGSAGTGGSCAAGAGGQGRVKLLYGATKSITGTVTAQRTDGILPPLQITSSTHPDPSLVYNDDFGTIALTWNKAFASAQGYYALLNTSSSTVPTPANALFFIPELTSYDRSKVSAGDNFFHIASVDSSSTVGTVETVFKIQVNTTPPSVSSSSHPSSTTWSTNNTVFYAWTLPNADANHAGFYYVLDHYGRTVPTKTDTFLPVTQKSLIRSGLVDGVWAFHVVSIDQRGYLTKQAGHYRVRIGADPGVGSILGTVVTTGGAVVSGALVTINNGLFSFTGEAPDQTTNGSGSYSFPAAVPAGTWEVTVTKTGFKPKTQTVVVTKAMSSTLNVTLDPG